MKKRAKMPSAEEHQKVFNSLVGNGFDFFEHAAREIDKEQKFAIAHFATGLELLLKARLFHEHWTLIALEPHRCAWTEVKDGTVRTLQASELCPAITTTTGTALIYERKAFKKIFDHRNQVLHWAPKDDLTTTVAEQCRAWHHLRELLTTKWAEAFDGFGARIEQVERQMRRQRAYLEVRFRQLEPKLKGLENAGLVVICPACQFRAGVAEDGPGRVHLFDCQVCGYSATALRADSGKFEYRERSEIVDELDPRPSLSPKERSMYEPTRGYCSECYADEATVAPDGGEYVCVECGTRFGQTESSMCEWCNERWFGWDSEGSYYSGCEHCDGQGAKDD